MTDNVVPIVREGVENRSATVMLDFGDGTYTFALRWGEIVTLQEERDAGPYLILDRLVSGRFLVQDVSAVIRLGLVGGGMPPAEALKKVRTYVEARPVMESVVLAQKILSAGVVGAPEEEVGKKPEAANPSPEGMNLSPTERSGLPPSTETAPS